MTPYSHHGMIQGSLVTHNQSNNSNITNNGPFYRQVTIEAAEKFAK
jgi:hypothetical protein